jgi:hypothetical protein
MQFGNHCPTAKDLYVGIQTFLLCMELLCSFPNYMLKFAKEGFL